jgi:phosphodiesterase/alkaline phosphatase D-like protein
MEQAPILDWTDVAGAGATYEVQVATDANFTNVVRSNTTLTASNWTVSPALSGSTTYYWRVRAGDTCSVGAYCTVGVGTQVFTHTFTLGTTTGNHAIRAQFRSRGTAGTCTIGDYNDRDDLVFNVGATVAAMDSGKKSTPQGRAAPAKR